MSTVTGKHRVTDENTVTLEQAIRRDYEAGMTYRQLAKKYRKSFRDIAAILKGPTAPQPKEVLSAELPAYLNDREVKNLVQGLLLTGRISFDDPKLESDVRQIAFELISKLSAQGWKVNRADLAKFLDGQLEFAVVRWKRE